MDQYEQEHIKPLVLQLLLSGELYCSVCSLTLKGFKTPQSSAPAPSHQAVLKALLRRGVHVVEADHYVSDSDLSSAPIKMVGGTGGLHGGAPWSVRLVVDHLSTC